MTILINERLTTVMTDDMMVLALGFSFYIEQVKEGLD